MDRASVPFTVAYADGRGAPVPLFGARVDGETKKSAPDLVRRGESRGRGKR
jgi:hypothetical protein